MNRPLFERVLALDVHPLSFGFVLLEGPERLIDWGVRSFRHGVNAVKVPMGKKLDLLFKQYQPSVLIVGNGRTGISRQMKVIARLAAAHHLRVLSVSRDSVRKAFPQSRNKYEIANAATNRCPDLSSYLPAKRKPWQSEKYAMSVFEAAALGLTYLAQRLPESDRPS
jgi:hypothetical protein